MDQWLRSHVWGCGAAAAPVVTDADLLLAPAWIRFLDLPPVFRTKLLRLLARVRELRGSGVVFPAQDRIMRWSHVCAPENIKVVILGQDPYHNGQAEGLAFSVRPGTALPPSLRNIFQEVAASVPGFVPPADGSLEAWARSGVLLLNTVLTVEKGRPNSHAHLGWEWFTTYIISALSQKLDRCVFMLWGSRAIEKAALVDGKKHLVLKANHPSPLAQNSSRRSAHPKFLGCGHFATANAFLSEHGLDPVDWTL